MNRNLTTEELAEIVRSPKETVRYWRHIGIGPAYFKIGRRVLYDEDVVQAWLEEQKAATVEPRTTRPTPDRTPTRPAPSGAPMRTTEPSTRGKAVR